ncbi:MAG: hypothetical protein JNM56_02270 [Planctomycetia bacterium]|nr:hypothetical protein [Planctomycetia bacterium]
MWCGRGSPPDTVLAHELGHARNGALGVNTSNAPMRTQPDINRWGNLEEYNNITYYDNPYRDKRGLPQRTGWDDIP